MAWTLRPCVWQFTHHLPTVGCFAAGEKKIPGRHRLPGLGIPGEGKLIAGDGSQADRFSGHVPQLFSDVDLARARDLLLRIFQHLLPLG
jgi:hypothetical protein